MNTSISPLFSIRFFLPFILIFLINHTLSGFGATDGDSPAGDGFDALRESMVVDQIAARGVEDRDVLQAMRTVPRHEFIPADKRHAAYEDHAVPIGYGQTISQPFIVAFMTESLDIAPGDRVLEIGTGSGYQAAVLATLTDEVYTVEIIGELASGASARLKELGYETVRVRQGDGYWGWDEAAPFDGIIVTAAAGHVPPPLLEQLAPGGRMIIPVGHEFDVQYLVLIEKNPEGALSGRQLFPVRFVPFTGRIRDTEP